MSQILILGATGNLGRVLVKQALGEGHQVSVVVRDPAKLPYAIAEQIEVYLGDLAGLSNEELARWVTGHEVLINAAGNVADGEGFTAGRRFCPGNWVYLHRGTENADAASQ